MQNWTITRVHEGERYVAPLTATYEEAMSYLDVVCALNPQDTYTLMSGSQRPLAVETRAPSGASVDLSAASQFLGRGLL